MSKTMKNLCLVMCLLALVTWTFAISGCGDSGSSDSGSSWWGDSGSGTTSPTPSTSPTSSPTVPAPGTPTVTSCTTPLVPNGACTITGTNFGATQTKDGKPTYTSYVTFQPSSGTSSFQPSAYTSWSDTQIVCTIPSSGMSTTVAYTAVLTVYNSSGQTATSSTTPTTGNSALPQNTASVGTVTAVSPTSAQASVTTLTITGTNFGASQTVTVGTVSALSSVQFITGGTTYSQSTVVAWSNTVVTAVAPSSVPAGVVTVKINTAQGGPSNETTPFTVTMTAAPTPTPSSSVNPSGYTWKTATQLASSNTGIVVLTRVSGSCESIVSKMIPVGSGKAVAVYMISAAGGTNRVWGRVWNGTAWTDNAQLDSNIPGAVGAQGVDLAVDSAGKVMAVWSQSDGSSGHIYYATYNTAASTPSWAIPSATAGNQRVSDASSGSSCSANTTAGYHADGTGDPQVAFDKNNNALVVWAAKGITAAGGALSQRIWSNYYSVANGAFAGCAQVQYTALGTSFCKKPKVAFLRNSTTGYIAWIESSATVGSTCNQVVCKQVSTSSTTATITTPTTYRLDSGNTATDHCDNPRLYLSDTRGICLFEKYDAASTMNHVYAARLTDSTTWTAATVGAGTGINGAVNLGPAGGVTSMGMVGPTGCLLTSDVPLVVFGRDNCSSAAGVTDGYQYFSKGTWSGTGITWDTPAIISGDFSLAAWYAQVACNGNFAIAIYQQNNSSASTRRIYYSTYNGTSWTKPASDAATYAIDLGYGRAENGMITQLTMDTASKAYAAFVESDGSSPQCYVNLYY